MSNWTALVNKLMTSGWYWGLIVVVSIIVALRNIYASFRIEKDIQKGIDPKVAAKYHRRLFYRKRDVLEYRTLLGDISPVDADSEANADGEVTNAEN